MTPLHVRLDDLARAPWLQNYWLYRLLFGFAILCDALIDWCALALYARYPRRAPPDALSVLGRERGIRRGFSEPANAYAQRLVQWLLDRKIKGSPYALMSQLAGYMHGHAAKLRVVNAAGSWYTRTETGGLEWHRASPSTWDWDGDATEFSRYWVIVYLPDTLWSNDGYWGDSGVWGDGGVWGFDDMTHDQALTIKAIVKEWNPPHAHCAGVIFTWDWQDFDPEGFGWTRHDGVNQYVDHGAPAALNFERTDSWTFAAWVRDDLDATLRVLFSKRSGEGYVFYRSAAGQYYLFARDDVPASHSCYSSAVPAGWHLVILRVTSMTAGATSIWINDADATVSSTTTLAGSIQSVGNFHVGRYSTVYHLGDIGPYAVWPRVLTDTECTAIWTAGRGGNMKVAAPDPLLLTRPHLDTYPTLIDHGSGGNDGTMTNQTANDLIKYPGGNWGRAGKTDGAGNYVLKRSPTMRYMKVH